MARKEISAKTEMGRLRENGFTLVELLVVIGLMGILLSLGTLSFHDWQVKNNLERQTTELFTDINATRLSAIHTKKRRGVVLNPGSYVLKNYSSDNEGITAGTVQKTTSVRFELKPVSGGSYTGEHYLFDSRGLLYNSTGTTITMRPFNTGSNDCIILAVGRINLGKMTNGTCVF